MSAKQTIEHDHKLLSIGVHVYGRFSQYCYLQTAWLPFLVACYATLHPASSVCPLVCWSVGPLVRWSVGPLVRRSVGVHESKSVKTRISAPAHPSATGMAVYLALFP